MLNIKNSEFIGSVIGSQIVNIFTIYLGFFGKMPLWWLIVISLYNGIILILSFQTLLKAIDAEKNQAAFIQKIKENKTEALDMAKTKKKKPQKDLRAKKPKDMREQEELEDVE